MLEPSTYTAAPHAAARRGGDDETRDSLLTGPVPAAHGEEDDWEGEGGGKASAVTEIATAETLRAAAAIVKAFIGSGALFLPKAFYNGGWLFSTITMVLMAALTQLTIVRLAQCRQATTGSYSQLGYKAFGNFAKYAVDLALILAQSGFGCVYVAFVARNVLQLLNVNRCWVGAEWLWLLIVIQFPLLVPLNWIRRMTHLAWPNAVANCLILGGLGGIIIYSATLFGSPVTHGVTLNTTDFPLFLGTAVYAYEGLGLVVPVYESLSPAGQKRFPVTLSITLAFVAAVYVIIGLVPYLAIVGVRGDVVQDAITLNLPRVWWAYIIIVGYCCALICTYVLQMFPVMRIVERGLTGLGVSRDPAVDVWKKNVARALVVAATLGVSIGSSSQLDNLVSLVGCFACTPLAFIFPCAFHLKLVGGTTWQRLSNMAIIVFGCGVFVFSTYMAIKTWGQSTVNPCLLTPTGA